jgi:hypothetical protein
MAHDYGDRQPRVDFLLEMLGEHPPDKVLHQDHTGRSRTAAELAHEIETGTLFGRGLVAIAGLVLQALGSDRPPGRKKAAP